MKVSVFLSLTACCFLFANNVNAQKGSDYIKAYKSTTCTIPFDVNSEGKAYHINWGMDAAWDWDFNVNRGINHIGKGNFSTGRISFQPNDLVTDNGDGTYTLSSRQQTKLKWRCDLIKRTGTTKVNINCDHEALFEDDNDKEDYTGRNNYQGKPEEWYKLIKASVQYAQKQGLTVISVSPFNEPDYVWQQAKDENQAMKDFLEIAKLIRKDPFFANIRISGGNTLNCDRALPWYNYLKEYLDEGNTHQLAGSLANYAGFFDTVTKDGKLGTGDELHNVGEAMVGAEHGMTSGIWWGFDGRARGQFCKDSNHGVRLGYAEDGNTWTSGSVYRNDDDNEIHAYIGSSERQASNASYRFVSTAHPVYFNGYGPSYEYVTDIPGGTGYQKGQINAEKLIDITYGEDVPQEEVNGTYLILSYNAIAVLSSQNAYSGAKIYANAFSQSNASGQQWIVKPENISGDCSYWTFSLNSNKGLRMNLLNNNLDNNAEAIVYDHNGKGAEENALNEEQWYLKYAGDGYWYIISRVSNKALKYSSTRAGNQVYLAECPSNTASLSTRKPFMWRFQPVDSKTNRTTPKWANNEITANEQNASIRVNWTAIEDTTVTYNVLRAKTSDNRFFTIARSVKGNTYLDNMAVSGEEYSYKIVPVAYNRTRGTASNTVTAKTLDQKTLIAQYQFDKNTMDNTDNQMDAAACANFNGTDGALKYATLSSLHKSGSAALNLSDKNTNSYLEIPSSLTNNDMMTISFWIRWAGTNSWERVFDFGNGTNQYMFFTPSNGSELRFVMKNNGDEQILSTGKKLESLTWKHIAITLSKSGDSKEDVKMYIDGEEACSATFTITPSQIAPVLNYIGRSQFAADSFLHGYLDDLRFYNYPLSADEVKALLTDTGEVASAIESTELQSGNIVPVAYYNTMGKKISQPENGVTIVRYSNDSTKKIIK